MNNNLIDGALVVSIVVLNLYDMHLTLKVLKMGATELNPIVNKLAETIDYPGAIAAVKIIVFIWLIGAMITVPPSEARTFTLICAYSLCLLGTGWNLSEYNYQKSISKRRGKHGNKT